VVGVSKSNSGNVAFLWTSRDGLTSLGTLPGDNTSTATRIDDSGVVVGSSTGQSGTRAVLWTKEHEIQNLGTLQSGDYSAAFGVNNSGEVVGTSNTSLGARAFLWTRQTGMVDLNTLIPTNSNIVLTSGQAINQRGQIIAVGGGHHDLTSDRMTDMDDEQHAGPVYLFLLTPSGAN
jgi:probable HAF family extracellular repeat protein